MKFMVNSVIKSVHSYILSISQVGSLNIGNWAFQLTVRLRKLNGATGFILGLTYNANLARYMGKVLMITEYSDWLVHFYME